MSDEPMGEIVFEFVLRRGDRVHQLAPNGRVIGERTIDRVDGNTVVLQGEGIPTGIQLLALLPGTAPPWWVLAREEGAPDE